MISAACLLWVLQVPAQCTFESLFPLGWGTGKFPINEKYSNDSIFRPGNDTITGSVFEHGLDYFFTVRHMDLYIFAYKNVMPHYCFKSGEIVLNCIAGDSGLVAYNYQVTYPATKRDEFLAVVDSLRGMMEKKFTYHASIKNTTRARDAQGIELTGEGTCVYFNDQPVIKSNLTYAQFVIRAGYLAKQPAKSESNMMMNQAEQIQFYRIEILYKRPQPSW